MRECPLGDLLKAQRPVISYSWAEGHLPHLFPTTFPHAPHAPHEPHTSDRPASLWSYPINTPAPCLGWGGGFEVCSLLCLLCWKPQHPSVLVRCAMGKTNLVQGFPGGAVVKNPPANEGDTGSSPSPGRSHMPPSN